jgi:hypothetical protein
MENQHSQQVEAKESLAMLTDKMKLAKKDDLINGQLIFWNPHHPTEDVGVVVNNDWEDACAIFWTREQGKAGQPDHYYSEWFDEEEGNIFVLRGTDDQSR